MIVVRIAYSDVLDVPAELMEAHKSHIRSSRLPILLSGPMHAADGTKYGAIVVSECASLDDMHDFSNNDPFVLQGIYRSVEIFDWRISFGKGLDLYGQI